MNSVMMKLLFLTVLVSSCEKILSSESSSGYRYKPENERINYSDKKGLMILNSTDQRVYCVCIYSNSRGIGESVSSTSDDENRQVTFVLREKGCSIFVAKKDVTNGYLRSITFSSAGTNLNLLKKHQQATVTLDASDASKLRTLTYMFPGDEYSWQYDQTFDRGSLVPWFEISDEVANNMPSSVGTYSFKKITREPFLVFNSSGKNIYYAWFNYLERNRENRKPIFVAENVVLKNSGGSFGVKIPFHEISDDNQWGKLFLFFSYKRSDLKEIVRRNTGSTAKWSLSDLKNLSRYGPLHILPSVLSKCGDEEKYKYKFPIIPTSNDIQLINMCGKSLDVAFAKIENYPDSRCSHSAYPETNWVTIESHHSKVVRALAGGALVMVPTGSRTDDVFKRGSESNSKVFTAILSDDPNFEINKEADISSCVIKKQTDGPLIVESVGGGAKRERIRTLLATDLTITSKRMHGKTLLENVLGEEGDQHFWYSSTHYGCNEYMNILFDTWRSKVWKKQSDRLKAGPLTERTLEKKFVNERKKMVVSCIKEILAYDTRTRRNFKILKKSAPQLTDLNSELDNHDEIVPRVGIVFSGGGYRAMIEAAGYTQALEENGLLDLIMYLFGLSGSAWFVIAHAQSGKSVEDFCKTLKLKVQSEGRHAESTLAGVPVGTLINLFHELLGDFEETYGKMGCLKDVYKGGIDHFFKESGDKDYFTRKFLQSRMNQFHGLIGVYGHALAKRLLCERIINGERLKVSHTTPITDLRGNFRHPLPVCVAVDFNEENDDNFVRTWFEINPYYFGFIHKRESSSEEIEWGRNRWFDSKHFGSLFEAGSLTRLMPEYPLAQIMGICGSAFALAPKDIGKESFAGEVLAKSVHGFLNSMNRNNARERFVSGRINNPLFCKEAQKGTFESRETLDLADAGIVKEGGFRHNLATIPALARECDVIIICDSPENPNTDDYCHLRASVEEAEALGYKLLPEGYEEELEKFSQDDEKTAVVFKNADDVTAPVVVYMTCKKIRDCEFDPDAKKAKFTKTSNFNYSEDQFEKLHTHAREIMNRSLPEVKKAVLYGIFKKLIERAGLSTEFTI